MSRGGGFGRRRKLRKVGERYRWLARIQDLLPATLISNGGTLPEGAADGYQIGRLQDEVNGISLLELLDTPLPSLTVHHQWPR